MAKIIDTTFTDMLTTQDMGGGCYSAERKIDKQEEMNHRNASEYNASMNYGKKKTTTQMKDASSCMPKKKKK